MPSVHSKLSPSGADRWVNCPGSLQFDSIDSPSQYAAQGTVAHGLGHQCHLLGVGPERFLGQVRHCDGYEITIDQEMVDAVNVYLKVLEEHPEAILETRIEHPDIEGFGGTVDCFDGETWDVIDFKYGAGIAVEAENNLQLACYALLAIEKFNAGQIVDVRLNIVQPRAIHPDGPIRSWVASADFLEYTLQRIKEIASGKFADRLNAGDHCRWCPAKAQCPELYEMTLISAKQEFAPHEMNVAKAAQILQKRSAIEGYLDAIEQWIHGQLDKGIAVPGYKLVNRYGNRRYAVDEATVEKRCKSKGFGKKQIYETSLLSPAQLEKVVGKELIASLVERPHLGTTVVPSDDKREAVKRLTASEEFANLS